MNEDLIELIRTVAQAVSRIPVPNESDQARLLRISPTGVAGIPGEGLSSAIGEVGGSRPQGRREATGPVERLDPPVARSVSDRFRKSGLGLRTETLSILPSASALRSAPGVEEGAHFTPRPVLLEEPASLGSDDIQMWEMDLDELAYRVSQIQQERRR